MRKFPSLVASVAIFAAGFFVVGIADAAPRKPSKAASESQAAVTGPGAASLRGTCIVTDDGIRITFGRKMVATNGVQTVSSNYRIAGNVVTAYNADGTERRNDTYDVRQRRVTNGQGDSYGYRRC